MELEVVLVHGSHLVWKLHIILLVAILDQNVRDEIKEDKRACSRTECHMNAIRLDLEAFAHWPFDIVRILG